MVFHIDIYQKQLLQLVTQIAPHRLLMPIVCLPNRFKCTSMSISFDRIQLSVGVVKLEKKNNYQSMHRQRIEKYFPFMEFTQRKLVR